MRVLQLPKYPLVSEWFLVESSDDESAPSAPLYSPISQPDLELCHSSSMHRQLSWGSWQYLTESLEDIQPLKAFEDDHSVLTESQKDIQPPAVIEDVTLPLLCSQRPSRPFQSSWCQQLFSCWCNSSHNDRRWVDSLQRWLLCSSFKVCDFSKCCYIGSCIFC